MSTFIHAMAASLQRASAPLMCLALLFHIFGLIVTGERWRVILTRLGSPMTLGRAILVNLSGIFVRNIIPACGVGGDAVRIALFRAGGASLPNATVALVCGRLAEIPAIVLLVIAALPAVGAVLSRSRAIGWTIVALFILTVAALIAWKPGALRIDRLREKFGVTPPPIGAMTVGTAWATVSWLETAARLMVVAAALGVRLTLAQGAALTVLSIVGGLVPTVGSLGAIEGSLMAGLLLFSVPAATATAIVLVERSITYVCSTVAGGAALVAVGGWDLVRASRFANAELPPGSYRRMWSDETRG